MQRQLAGLYLSHENSSLSKSFLEMIQVNQITQPYLVPLLPGNPRSLPYLVDSALQVAGQPGRGRRRDHRHVQAGRHRSAGKIHNDLMTRTGIRRFS